MIRSVLTLFSVAFACSLWAQSPLEKRAEKLMRTGHYEESYALWSMLAERCGGCPDRAAFARESAMRAGQFDEALRWSAEVLKADTLRTGDVQVHLELMRRNGLGARIPTLLNSPLMAQLPAAAREVWLAEQAEIDAWEADEDAFTVERFRPLESVVGWAAVPYEEGLIYQTQLTWDPHSPLNPTETAPERARLVWLENRRSGAASTELLDGFEVPGARNRHVGPIAFNESGDWAAVTCSKAMDRSSDRESVPLELLLFRKGEDGWEPLPAPPWNSPNFSTAHATFHGDSALIFASNRPGGEGGMDLYRTELGTMGWKPPVNLGAAVNTAGNELFPFAIGGDFLYFASDGHVTAGGLDVFGYRLGANQVDRLPAPINSPQDDFAFHFNEASGEGWLSSSRSGSDGIYRVTGKPIGSEVQVLVQSCDGSPLSGAEVEFVDLLANESERIRLDDEGRWTTTAWTRRPYELRVLPVEGMGGELTRRFVLDSLVYQLVVDLNEVRVENSVVVLDERGNPAEGVLLEFTSANGDLAQFLTDEKGQFAWNPDSKSNDYVELKTSLINYEDEVSVFTKPPSGCYTSATDTITMQPVTEQVERIDLAAILYDSGSAMLREDSKLELDKLVAFLRDRPNLRVELSAHTDCRDDTERNLKLSQSRAEACVEYIIAKGIDSGRILARGYGESQLLNDCSDLSACGCVPVTALDCVPCSEEMHQQNRRTELRLLTD